MFGPWDPICGHATGRGRATLSPEEESWPKLKFNENEKNCWRRRPFWPPDPRWKPKHEGIILGERNGITHFDLQKALKLFPAKASRNFVGELSASGKTLAVHRTKAPCARKSVAEKKQTFAVCSNVEITAWALGGHALTNWATFQKSIKRLKTLRPLTEDCRMAASFSQKSGRAPGPRVLKHPESSKEPFWPVEGRVGPLPGRECLSLIRTPKRLLPLSPKRRRHGRSLVFILTPTSEPRPGGLGYSG